MENLLTWPEIEKEMERVFAPEQASILGRALGSLYQMELNRASDTRELKQGLAALAAAQARTEQRLEELAAAQARTEVRLGRLTGWQLEHRYHQRAMAYFGRLLRRVRVLSLQELEEALEPRLSAEEWEDLLELDLLVSGQPRYPEEVPPVWLAVEVSATVDPHDVERALRRAAALRRAGYRTIPTVAGEQVAEEAEKAIRAGHLLLVLDGRPQFWEEALAAAMAD